MNWQVGKVSSPTRLGECETISTRQYHVDFITLAGFSLLTKGQDLRIWDTGLKS
jgi:hypothetical protein